jgi:hypothetical protein
MPSAKCVNEMHIFLNSDAGTIAHEATHKAWATADEYQPFRNEVWHDGKPSLMSATRGILLPHHLTHWAKTMGDALGRELEVVHNGTAVPTMAGGDGP